MIHITQYKHDYYDELREVFFTAIHQVANHHYNSQQLHAWAPVNYDKPSWAKRLDSIKPFMAFIDNKLVGYADVQKDGYIDHFFVHGDYQQLGIAKALMNKIIESSVNSKPLYSHVSLSAYDFFKAQGFIEINTQQASINAVQLSNFLMQKI